MEKRWLLSDNLPEESLKDLSTSLNINGNLVRLLLMRGITTFDVAKDFFRPSLSQLHDPFLMKGMEKAVNRLCEAIFNGEKILIYGDYDVDGTTAVSLVYGFLSSYSKYLEYYIPDRYTEGYGISAQSIEWAHENGIDLIISLDCGIRAVERARQAKACGIDLIICDHHLPGPVLPDAYAILDPKQDGDLYPFKELSGCGVGFKLLQAFCLQNTIPAEKLYKHLDLVAVSIASDIVPIVGENRILAFYGLKKLNHSPCPGLKALIEVSGLTGEIDISCIVFYLGPRINAAGRLTHARESVKLLLSKNAEDTARYADILNDQNTERRGFDQAITAEALEMVAADEMYAAAKSTVLFKEDWHKGVIGIVASRCIEKFYRPTIILTQSDTKATGSARSVEGFDIHEAISACADLLEQFGGHTHAAGLSLAVENVEAFRQKFEEVVSATILPEQLLPKLEIDLEVDFDFINFKTYHIIRQMAPFGPKNPKPVFLTKNVVCRSEPNLLKEQHLKVFLCQKDGRTSIDAIGFGLGEKLPLLQSGKPLHVVYQIEENEYRGNKSLQLNIKDIKIA